MAEKLPETEKGRKITVKIIKPQSINLQKSTRIKPQSLNFENIAPLTRIVENSNSLVIYSLACPAFAAESCHFRYYCSAVPADFRINA